MPRPLGFDRDELRAAWQSGNFQTADAVMDFLGIDQRYRRSVQDNIRREFGPRPRRPEKRGDWLREAVLNWMQASGLDLRYCYQCNRRFGHEPYLRTLRHEGRLEDVVVVCNRCKRVGDK
ncbi:hypothetical protein AB0H71_29045 [Nocardia sp. NPDC050697]|uniref:hypothetical protein n=1 Tax=Nocardia sp. NPDC050697 TaxID=3155158 RepID=UPI0033E0F5F3